MSNLISDVVFTLSILVLLATCVRGIINLLPYAKTDWEQATAWTYWFFQVLGVLLFAVATLYILIISNIHILPAEHIKLEGAIYFLVVAIASYFLSTKNEKRILDYCIKYELLGGKEEEQNNFNNVSNAKEEEYNNFSSVSENAKYSNQTPVWKFVFLSFISLGYYELYWMYKQWKFFKERNDLKIRPFWRSVLWLFFTYSLLKKISQFAEEIEYNKKFDAGFITFLYLGIYVFARLPDPIWIVCMFTSLALIIPVQVMNFYWSKEQPNLPLKPFRWWEILLVLLLVIFTTLVISETFFPSV
jgi:hypothetical protein